LLQKDCRSKDLTGQRFGKLIVVAKAGLVRERDQAWACKCDCGKTKIIVGYSLTGGKSTACGCLKGPKVRNLIGRRFGRLVVLSKVGVNSRKSTTWLCACDCGKTVIASSADLFRGHTVSCKCFSMERFRTMVTHHGQARRSGYSGAFKSWGDMIKRCTNPNTEFWKNYGGRGISVCEK